MGRLEIALACLLSLQRFYGFVMSASKVALVTGGGKGIGGGVSEVLASAGHDLVLGYKSDEATCTAHAQTLTQKYGVRCIAVGGDAAKTETRDAYFKAIDEEFGGRLDVCVHVGGGVPWMPQAYGDGSMLTDGGETDLEQTQYFLELYGHAFIDLAERSIVRMEQGGHIVGISSPGCNVIGARPAGFYSTPGAGKAVMEYSARQLALTAGVKSINVNIVVPGYTDTAEWQRAGFSKEYLLKKVQEFPIKHLLEPMEIARCVGFLCSDAGRFVTGTVMFCDCGRHLV